LSSDVAPRTRQVELDDELTIEQLAAAAELPSRTIREYQTMGLVPPPEKRGRVGLYRRTHLERLRNSGRLQDRGYSLAGIRDLLTSWHDGDELTDILGVGPDELVHIDEPGAPASLEQLQRLLPQLVPARLDDLLAVGLVDHCGPDRYCIPSPSLLQLAVDALAAGYTRGAVLELLASIHTAAQGVAAAAEKLLTRPPAGLDDDAVAQLAARGRGLLAHGTGRLTVYELGRRLDPDTPPRRHRTGR
jgi:DNA-binding transcriptional MerR regulator